MMMQHSTRGTLIRMRINVRSKVGVVKINFLVWTRSCRRDRVHRFSRYSPSTGILIALYPTGIASIFM